MVGSLEEQNLQSTNRNTNTAFIITDESESFALVGRSGVLFVNNSSISDEYCDR